MFLTRLIVPGEKTINDKGNVVESSSTAHTDKAKVQDLLIERDVKHFSLAENTSQGITGFIY